MKGREGAALGAGAGLGAGLLSNAVGDFAAKIAGPRTLGHQQRYNEATGQTVGNWLVPGMAGFNKARTKLTDD